MPDQVVDRIPQSESIRGAAGNSHPSLPDPADLTAVSLGGIRIDLNKLTLLEKEPAILISGTAPDANQKKEESTQAKKTDAGVPAEQEQKLAEAKKITYWELKTASKEEQAKILEARKLIINSTSWGRTDTTPIRQTRMGSGSRTSPSCSRAGRCPRNKGPCKTAGSVSVDP